MESLCAFGIRICLCFLCFVVLEPFKNFIYLIYLSFWLCWVFVAARGLSLVAVSGLLIVVASLVVEHRS